MKNVSEVRVDKFLWSVRLYKTRSLATEACKKGKILINELPVKASRLINSTIEFSVRKDNAVFRYKIKQLLNNRVGAKLVDEYIENITPKEELEKLELDRLAKNLYRNRGEGRPTKKDRRDIQRFFDDE
ncbi:MAG: RNA-binding S4 domain-containing protein [Bacteroidales bacterium]|nr:RNA-binding S4 domain-containing protein [Bacteroidales bacterium]